MLSRRPRRPRGASAADFSTVGGVSKPPRSRGQERDALTRMEQRQIRQTRERVVDREGDRCRCGCARRQLEMHETRPDTRAQTRGRPPAERFNTIICCLLSQHCHRLVTEGLLHVDRLTRRGCDGPLRFTSQERPQSRSWVTE